jgi:hypothetical protein
LGCISVSHGICPRNRYERERERFDSSPAPSAHPQSQAVHISVRTTQQAPPGPSSSPSTMPGLSSFLNICDDHSVNGQRITLVLVFHIRWSRKCDHIIKLLLAISMSVDEFSIYLSNKITDMHAKHLTQWTGQAMVWVRYDESGN